MTHQHPPKYTPEQEAEYQVGYRALLLAPTLEIYRALIQGENVPVELLDQRWVKRYGLRK